ncbi:50S ribosomal protein L3 [Porphyridium purpureum]|uniref:Large ribosomal subunit protein uL3m n=1 Tax=Porphyridium purpureum TaxID=35688 RepID=A0A5J4YUR3_PORPP|nr:50S ribosomal protein L3 [Porphyridium purpureum]|eukprot:POR5059..scf227_4
MALATLWRLTARGPVQNGLAPRLGQRGVSKWAFVGRIQDATQPPPPGMTVLPNELYPYTRQTRRCGVLGRKAGMMSMIDEATGYHFGVTVVLVERCHVLMHIDHRAQNTTKRWNMQIGAGFRRPHLTKKPLRFHCAKAGVETKEKLIEFTVSDDALVPVGTRIGAEHFVVGQKVDVLGTSKGKGFQGVVKRWGFSGQPATHGSKTHRAPGSIGSFGRKGKVAKGTKMAGRMGGDSIGVFGLKIVRVDPKKSVLFIKGCIPGPNGGWVRITDSAKNYKILAATGGPYPPVPTCLEPVEDRYGSMYDDMTVDPPAEDEIALGHTQVISGADAEDFSNCHHEVAFGAEAEDMRSRRMEYIVYDNGQMDSAAQEKNDLKFQSQTDDII